MNRLRGVARNYDYSAVVILAVMAASSAWAAPEAARLPQPKLALPARSQDAGDVEQGTLVAFRFTVRNIGSADLEIRSVKPSCGCTAPRWDRVVRPGLEGAIEAQMNTRDLRGAVTKQLIVMTNDPERAQQVLNIKARVIPVIHVEPAWPVVLDVQDQPVSQSLILERNGGRSMKITGVIKTPPFILTEVRPLPGEGRYQLTVTATPAAPFGRTTTLIVVETDLEQAPKVWLNVTVIRGIVAVPPTLSYGILPAQVQTPIQATVTLQRREPGFHIERVEASDPVLLSNVVTVRDGSEYRITVSYKGGWSPGFQARTLIVSTDDPKQPVLKIPVQGMVQPQTAEGVANPSVR